MMRSMPEESTLPQGYGSGDSQILNSRFAKSWTSGTSGATPLPSSSTHTMAVLSTQPRDAKSSVRNRSMAALISRGRINTRAQSAGSQEHRPVQVLSSGDINDDAFGLVPLGNLSANLRHLHKPAAVQQRTEPHIGYRPPGVRVAENAD